MKVESKTDFLTPTAADVARIDADRSSAASSRPGPSAPVADQVTLSSDVQLVQTASRAAESAPAVRPDKVAEAKALLAEGKVGTNLDSLASAILDSLTK